jgi:molybdate transport system substrate-binding protein
MLRVNQLPTVIAGFCLLAGSVTFAGEVNIAVASNFSRPLKKISQLFENRTGHRVNLSVGSTGKHYTQIHHGAPFDLFYAADSKRPALLEKERLIIPGSRFTYAIGKLVLWSPRKDYVDNQGMILQQHGAFQHIAIANPRLAPYGRAAKEVLEAKGLWKGLFLQAVRGENIGQTFQFVKSGNAELGFVAWSQIQSPDPDQSIPGSYWDIPASLYSPIEQQAVQLTASPIASDFLNFSHSQEVAGIIRQSGYDLP